jgi:hypothetical protein
MHAKQSSTEAGKPKLSELKSNVSVMEGELESSGAQD